MNNYIFISYAHRDAESVLPILNRLRQNGYRTWYDGDIDAAREWDKEIADHVENCGFFIAFMSQAYLDSSNCRDEVSFARDLNKKQVLVYLDDVTLPSELRMRLSRSQNIYHFQCNSDEEFYDRLFRADGIEVCRDETFVASEDNIAGVQKTAGRVSKRFENVSVENRFTERVSSDSFNDGRSRGKLFSLYADLVAPLQQMEAITGEMDVLQESMQQLRDSRNIRPGIGPRLAIGVFILVFFLQWSENIFGASFEVIAAPIVDPLVAKTQEIGPIIRIFALLLCALLASLITPLFWSAVYLAIWGLYFVLIRKGTVYERNTRRAEEQLVEYRRLSESRDEVFREIQEQLKYVPKQYRHSEAMEYLSTLYQNSRADTLKEAVNLYEANRRSNGAETLRDAVVHNVEYLSEVSEQLEI